MIAMKNIVLKVNFQNRLLDFAGNSIMESYERRGLGSLDE